MIRQAIEFAFCSEADLIQLEQCTIAMYNVQLQTLSQQQVRRWKLSLARISSTLF